MTTREQELASALERYTDPSNPEYDAKFDKQVRQLRPDWFADTEEDLPPIEGCKLYSARVHAAA